MPQLPYPISGRITDSNSTVAVNAIVEIFNLRTSQKADGKTNASGDYVIDLTTFDFNNVENDPLLIRSFIGSLFRYAELRTNLLLGAGAMEDQDLTLVSESPEQPNDVDHKFVDLKEHHTTANAKKFVRVDIAGQESENILDKYRTSGLVIDGSIRYYPFLDMFGNWYVRRDDLTDSNNRTYRYSKGNATGLVKFPSNDLTKLKALKYGLFNVTFRFK